MNKQRKIKISIVSPVFNSEKIIRELVSQIQETLKFITKEYEIILVEDGSPDGSWREIQDACRKNNNVIGIRLSRNFGQHYAISAGLSQARGRRIVVMDCDLQDRPSEIPRLLKKADEGYDIVLARRTFRKDKFLKKLSSNVFYKFLSWLTGVAHDPSIANFGVYSDKVIAAINSMPESIRYFPTMVRWVGFQSSSIDVHHSKRADGESSYNFKKLLNLGLDICLAYSDKPLRIVISVGFFVSLMGIIFALITLLKTLRGEITVLGYASLIVSLWILAGLIIFIVGVVGLYVGKAFEGIKERPAFIVAEEIRNTCTN